MKFISSLGGYTASKKARPGLLAFLIAATLLCVLRAAIDLSAPLDCDEIGYPADFKSGVGLFAPRGVDRFPGGRLLNLSSNYHTFSRVLSWGSMSIFGPSAAASRLAGLFLALGFLVVCSVFCYRYLSALAGVLLFLHFLVNENVNWFFHSSRGYPMLLLITMGSLLLVWQAIVQKKASKSALILFGVMCLASLWNHHLGIFQLGALLCGAVLWVCFHRSALGSDEKKVPWSFVRVFAGFLPLMLVLAYFSFKILVLVKQVETPPVNILNLVGRPWMVFSSMGGALGLFRARWVFALAGMVVFLIVFPKSLSLANRSLSFLWAFVLTTFALLCAISVALPSLDPRYMLWFVPPLILALGESCSEIKNYRVRLATGLALILVLVVVPIFESHPNEMTNLGFCEPSTYQPRLPQWFPFLSGVTF